MALISPSGEYLLLAADSMQTVLPNFPDRWPWDKQTRSDRRCKIKVDT